MALFRHTLELGARAMDRPRPALFCGFNGLVFEKFEEGLAWRLGYDVIALNGPRDRRAFEEFVRGSPFAAQPHVVTGLHRRPSAPARSTKGDAAGRKLFVFAEQVVAPRLDAEREALVSTLLRLANNSPNWDVILKARVRREGQTFHFQTGHIADVVDAIGPTPPNFSVSYAPLDDLLARADLFATMSSTALFDALDHGVPSLVAADFGVRNADGLHVFFASGLMASLAELGSLDDAPPLAADPDWLEWVGYAGDASPDTLVDWLEAFDPSRPPPPAFVPARKALQASANSRTYREIAEAAWRDAENALETSDQRRTARALLPRLGAALSAATVLLPEGWGDDAGAALARKVKMYRLYKRLRAKLGRPMPD